MTLSLKKAESDTTAKSWKLCGWRTLSRAGECPHCGIPRRLVCGWEWDSFSDGQTEFGASVGDAALVRDCATHLKESICVQASCFELSETYYARSHGFPTCSHPSMILASMRSRA